MGEEDNWMLRELAKDPQQWLWDMATCAGKCRDYRDCTGADRETCDHLRELNELSPRPDPGRLLVYWFSYPGLWLGGRMAVIAPSKERAVEIFLRELAAKPEDEQCDHGTNWLHDPQYHEPLGVDEIKEGVLFDENGNY